MAEAINHQRRRIRRREDHWYYVKFAFGRAADLADQRRGAFPQHGRILAASRKMRDSTLRTECLAMTRFALIRARNLLKPNRRRSRRRRTGLSGDVAAHNLRNVSGTDQSEAPLAGTSFLALGDHRGPHSIR